MLISALIAVLALPAAAATLEARLKETRAVLSSQESQAKDLRAKLDALEASLQTQRARLDALEQEAAAPPAPSTPPVPPSPPRVRSQADLSGEWSGGGVTLKLIHAGGVSGLVLSGGKVAPITAGEFNVHDCSLTLAYDGKQVQLTLSSDGLALSGAPFTVRRPAAPNGGCRP